MKSININENLSLEWLGHASFLISFNGLNVFIDPFQIETDKKADLIFITHHHYDHYSITDLKKIIKEDTVIYLPKNCLDKINESDIIIEKVLVESGYQNSKKDIGIKVVPSYNIDKQFHKKDQGWVGYILDFNGVKIYHSGDTDVIPEMDGFDVDVALLPVGGTYTMDAKEAAKACGLIKPKMFAIPMHYNKIVGTIEAGNEFERLAPCKVMRLD